MSARENGVLQSAANQIGDLVEANEMACLNLQILMTSIVKSIDETGGDVYERFDAINCYVDCARPILDTVLANSLATAKIAREVKP